MSGYLLKDRQLISTFLAHSAAIDLNQVIASEKTAKKTGKIRALTPSAAIASGLAKAPVTRRGAKSKRRGRRAPREIDFSIEPTSKTPLEIEQLPNPLHIPRRQVETSREKIIHPLLSSFNKAKKDIIIDQRLYQRDPSEIFHPVAIPKLFHSAQNVESLRGLSQAIRPTVIYDHYISGQKTTKIQQSLVQQNFHLQALQSLQEEAFQYEKLHRRVTITPKKVEKRQVSNQNKRQSLNLMPLRDIDLNDIIKKLTENENFAKFSTQKKVEYLVKRYFDLLLFILGDESDPLMNLSQEITYALKLLGDDSPPQQYKYVEFPENIGSLMKETRENISWIISEMAVGKTSHKFEECISPVADAFFSAIVNAALRTRNILEKQIGPLKGINRFEYYEILNERLDKGIIPKIVANKISLSKPVKTPISKKSSKVVIDMNTKNDPNSKSDTTIKSNTPKKKTKRIKLANKNVSKSSLLSSKSNAFFSLNSPKADSNINDSNLISTDNENGENFSFQTQAPITVPQAKFLDSDDKNFFLSFTPYIIPPVLLLKYLN